MDQFHFSYAFIFVILSGTINILLILYSIGYLKTENVYITAASFILRLFIGIILIITYNPIYPLRKRFKDLDNKIVFSAGMYITIINLLNAYNTYVLNDKSYKLNHYIT